MNIKEQANDMKGMSLSQAVFNCKAYDIKYRVVCMDGYYYIVTRDYNTNRLNFTVNSGIVTEVTIG